MRDDPREPREAPGDEEDADRRDEDLEDTFPSSDPSAVRRVPLLTLVLFALGELEPGLYRAVVRLNGGAPLTRGLRVTT